MVQICGCSGWISVVTSKQRICWLSHCAGSGCWRRNKIKRAVHQMVFAEKGHCPITLCPACHGSEMAVKEEWASRSVPSSLPTRSRAAASLTYPCPSLCLTVGCLSWGMRQKVMTSRRKQAAKCPVLSSKYKPISKSSGGQKRRSTARDSLFFILL